MNNRIFQRTGWSLLTVVSIVLLSLSISSAHCDTMDGPVIAAANQALESGNVNLVLVWVQPGDATEIQSIFKQTLEVRKLNPQAKALADMYFFERLVRIHRAGEGEPYTGIKPTGTPVEPIVKETEAALASGNVESLQSVLSEALNHELSARFNAAKSHKNYNRDDIEAGREYVERYVTLLHYAEGLHSAITAGGDEHHASNQQEGHGGHK